ncbi:molecular chaperone hsp90 [Stylonychia lemnae]|uniref:Molecular chaperone hsp90 n=1 Tax=Stylonychia lemnae TaxID=5949 RepID=A0A078A7T2_STYLE|nr:molecular chaperone hsp90 [Stylonychia lemnae]|eukprot:CDW77637.1 molecular chaperone hsp90 [Stylonychia lemnae]
MHKYTIEHSLLLLRKNTLRLSRSSRAFHIINKNQTQLVQRFIKTPQLMFLNSNISYEYINVNLGQRQFSNSEGQKKEEEQPIEVVIDELTKEESEPILKDSEKMEFKAETKKLLDIVAKSIYTDKEVFLRELLSNCSDALEKQRFKQVSGSSQGGNDLYINITTNSKDRELVLFDSGIGMSREEIMDNLGTIAKSGSQAFLKEMKDKDVSLNDSIIGQFGVGFYSTFIVSDSVEVYSKAEGHNGVRWVSDGSGEYEISNADNLGFERGTRIVLKLRQDCREFSTENELEKIIKKFSQFISYPIKLNGQMLNNLQAIWYRDKREITTDEYERFYESVAKTKIPYKYLLHYSTDVPLSIKALIYIPSTHNEKYGIQNETQDINLYSRKILIKQNCSELLPNYLRFIKGVVDCEDLPLNISRETYQDSSLMNKLRNAMTRRILKLLEEEARKDKPKYNKWYEEFNNFLKEGLTSDTENSEALFKLLRFNANFSKKELVSLDEYIEKMKPSQDKIFFIVNPQIESAMNSPYMEPFKGTDFPVLILSNNIDEICFQQSGNYKGKSFVNVETSYEEIQKDLGKKEESSHALSKIPEDEIAPFSLWLKNELQPQITKISLSKRLKDAPAVIVGQQSSSMRMMMQMMDPSAANEGLKDQTLEINASHPIIVNLNYLRKHDAKLASLATHTLIDNINLLNGTPADVLKLKDRSFEMLEKFLDHNLEGLDPKPQRKLKAKSQDLEIELPEDIDSVLKKSHEDLKEKKSDKIVREHVVGSENNKNQ